MKTIKFIPGLFFSFVFLLFFSGQTYAQNVTITDDNAYSADGSALLDVKSTDKGLLVPRMTSALRTSITSPASGLLVFDTDKNSFYYYAGAKGWINLSTEVVGDATVGIEDPIFKVLNDDGDTIFAVYPEGVRIQVGDGNAKGAKGGFAVGGITSGGKLGGGADYLTIQDSSIRMYVSDPSSKGAKGGFAVGGLTSGSKIDPVNFMDITPLNYFIGYESGSNIINGLYNTTFGYQAGHGLMTGDSNIFIGYQAGYNNNSYSNIYIGNHAGSANNAYENVYIGTDAGRYGTTGQYNTFIGTQAGMKTTGSLNTFVGNTSGENNTSGAYNCFYGLGSGWQHTQGNENVFIGVYSGANNLVGKGNVFIGNRAGYNEPDSNKLYIENSTSPSPLIWGDFLTNDVKIYGDLQAYSYGNFSDGRLKNNFAPLNNPIEQINKINGGYFYWNQEIFPEMELSERRQIGVIAQEVEKIFPELVFTDKKGYKSVDYTKFTPILIEAIKELSAEIEQLKTEQQQQIEALKMEIEALKE